MHRRFLVASALCVLIAGMLGPRARAQSIEERNIEINNRINANFSRIVDLRDAIAAAADLTTAKARAAEMSTALTALNQAILDKYQIVQELEAENSRLSAENERLKAQFAPDICCTPECKARRLRCFHLFGR